MLHTSVLCVHVDPTAVLVVNLPVAKLQRHWLPGIWTPQLQQLPWRTLWGAGLGVGLWLPELAPSAPHLWLLDLCHIEATPAAWRTLLLDYAVVRCYAFSLLLQRFRGECRWRGWVCRQLLCSADSEEVGLAAMEGLEDWLQNLHHSCLSSDADLCRNNR